MTTRNLDALFRPASIALVGVSSQRDSIGAVLKRNLLGAGYKGQIWAVNPRRRRVRGAKAYRSLSQLPQAPDLGVVCMPLADVPQTLADLGRQGARAAVVIPTSFTEDWEEEGRSSRAELVAAAQTARLRVLGPYSLGILVPGIGLNASLAHRPANQGNIALVSHSGAIITSVLDWADGRGIGFSALVSLGDMADVDLGDVLDYLAIDPGTRAILLHIESVGDTRKFMSAARAASRLKPVVVLKPGHRAGASQSGTPEASDAVYQAAFDRTGVLRVFTLAALFDAAEILALARPPKGDRLAVFGNGRGMAVLAADALIEEGGRLANLSEETRTALHEVPPSAGPDVGPVDLGEDATGERYRQVLSVIAKDPGVDGILALHCPNAMVSAPEVAEAVASAPREGHLLLTCWIGGAAMAKARRHLDKAGIPNFGTPEQAVRAFMYLVRYRRSQRLLSETPPPLPKDEPPDKVTVAGLIAAALAQDRHGLTETESTTVLEGYGIRTLVTRAAASPEETANGKAQIGGLELILGVADDPQFGPVIRVAPGGARVDREADGALALLPLDLALARQLLLRSGVHPALRNAQETTIADLEPAALTLVRVSQLLVDHPQIQTLEIDPLLADATGVLALNARVTLAEPQRPGPGRFAIRPYPQELEEWVPADEGRQFLLRPIRPEDEPALREAFTKLTPEEVRLRFFVPMPSLSQATAARLSQVDYDREVALLLTEPQRAGPDAIYGVVRLIAAPDNERAEFAIIVGHPLTGRGLGTLMMRRILAYARDQGIHEVFGVVLAENSPMLRLSDKLGFQRRTNPEEPGTILVTRSVTAE